MCAYAGTGDVLIVQGLLRICSESMNDDPVPVTPVSSLATCCDQRPRAIEVTENRTKEKLEEKQGGSKYLSNTYHWHLTRSFHNFLHILQRNWIVTGHSHFRRRCRWIGRRKGELQDFRTGDIYVYISLNVRKNSKIQVHAMVYNCLRERDCFLDREVRPRSCETRNATRFRLILLVESRLGSPGCPKQIQPRQ